MKCQSCHFISSNYRLACRPFNDHLQHCLQCIRRSTKSLSRVSFFLRTHTYTLSHIHYHELAQTLIGTQKVHACKHTLIHERPEIYTPTTYSCIIFPNFLFICNVQNKNSLSRLPLACQSKAE